MKSRLVIIMIFCCTLFSGCGVMRKVALEDSTTISYSDDSSVDVTIVGDNLPIKLKDEELRQFVELVEERVGNDCIIGLQLQTMVDFDDMGSYGDDGYYVSIKYNPSKELYTGKSDKTRNIKEIYVLISNGEEKAALFVYCEENVYRVFNIWKTSYDLILEYLE